MPTILTHAVAGASLAQVLAPRSHRRAVTVLAAVTAMLPDADVVGFRLGVSYGDMLGHRGITHSLLFASVVALAGFFFPGAPKTGDRVRIMASIALATASHGFLDAFTDGGLGVAFFAPFDATRCFFPVTPIHVSPLSIDGLLSERGASVFASELLWVWGPALVIASAASFLRQKRPIPSA